MISLDEHRGIIDKFEKVLSRIKEKYNSQFYSSIMPLKDYKKRDIYIGPKLSKSK